VLAIDSRWLLAAVPGALLVASPDAEVEVGLEATQEALETLAAQLAVGTTEQAVMAALGAGPGELEELLRRLADQGALAEAPAEDEALVGRPLADALLDAMAGTGDGAHQVWTADELLILPEAAGPSARRRTLRAFVGGMESHARMAAYCQLVRTGRRSVRGDHPGRSELTAALERAGGLDPAQAHVVSLRDFGVQSAEPGGADAREPHRLGPVTEARAMSSPPTPRTALVLCMARSAHPNLRHPGTAHGWASGIAASWGEAELVARAEAAERYAAGDVTEGSLARASAAELEEAVDPGLLHAFNRRQLEGPWRAEAPRPERRYLWTPSTSGRWLPAGQVFSPFADPEGNSLPGLGSSGVAAHTTLEEAGRRALYELIERDAFMWTWVQQVARERIDLEGLPDAAAGQLRAVAAAGWSATLLNLTLDLKPVVLCVLEELEGNGVSLGIACAEAPADAAAKAVREALALLWADPAALADPIEPEDVALPLDHLRLHRAPGARERRDWLLSSTDTVELSDVRGQAGPVDQVVADVHEALFVDLGSRVTHPFAVVRAFVPGLVPISFGHDREPLGMPRLSEPKRTSDGRLLGQSLDLRCAGPIMPHPFS
jgi:thiazole/oxazole-forming peptide maturase SagD family component